MATVTNIFYTTAINLAAQHKKVSFKKIISSDVSWLVSCIEQLKVSQRCQLSGVH